MSGHTPGPWYAVTMPGWGDRLCIGRRAQSDADKTAGDFPIAVVYEGAAHWESKYPIGRNARLIAAAPELLAELRDYAERLLAFALLLPDPVEVMKKRDSVLALIAKAEGQS